MQRRKRTNSGNHCTGEHNGTLEPNSRGFKCALVHAGAMLSNVFVRLTLQIVLPSTFWSKLATKPPPQHVLYCECLCGRHARKGAQQVLGGPFVVLGESLASSRGPLGFPRKGAVWLADICFCLDFRCWCGVGCHQCLRELLRQVVLGCGSVVHANS